MDYKEAKEILEHHNKWRKGAEIKQLNPESITEAINVAVKLLNAFKEPVSKCEPPIIPDVPLEQTQYL